MSTYKNYALLVGNSAIGIRNRTKDTQTRYYRHPLVRKEWWTLDKFRGIQGYYYAKGQQKGSEQLFNYSLDSVWTKDVNRPFKFDTQGRFTKSSFTIYFDNDNWNLANRDKREVLDNYLSADSDTTTGNTNFYQYVAGNLGESAYYKEYYLEKQSLGVNLGPAIALDTAFYDHHLSYYFPSIEEAILEKSTYNLQVKSYYNYYLETYPPYEDVTAAAGRDVETILPNLYMLESDMRNTASVNYTSQLTLDKAGSFYNGPEIDVWFLKQNQISPASNKAYFQQFAETLNILNTTGKISATKKTFKSNFRDLVVLYSDLDILKKYNIRDDRNTPNDPSDDLSSTAFYPFYNEIIIGHDPTDTTGISARLNKGSLFASLLDSKLPSDEVHSFIVLLQLYIVENIRTRDAKVYPGQVYTREVIATNGETESFVLPADSSNKIVFDMQSFLAELNAGSLDYLAEMYNASKDKIAKDTNYTILRQWEEEELPGLDMMNAIKIANSIEFKRALEERKRSLKQIYNNEPASSETVLYIIEKSLSVPGKLNAPIQTFIISKDISGHGDLRYLDTQVQYGVRYKYDIKQVRVVFGNKYSYSGIDFDFGNLRIGSGRAVGNALGFYDSSSDPTISINGTNPAEVNEYKSPAAKMTPATTQVGNFIFKLPEDKAAALISTDAGSSSPTTGPTSELGRYYQAIVNGTADLSGMVLELHSGQGVNGNRDGGMSGYVITVPNQVVASTDLEMVQHKIEPQLPETNPIALYRRAIDLTTGDAIGGQQDADYLVEEIVENFRSLMENGAKAKINSYMASMKKIKANLKHPAAGVPSIEIEDPRLTEANRVYKTIEKRIKDMRNDMMLVPDVLNNGSKNVLLKEILGDTTDPQQTSTATTFEAPKGFGNINMRFR